MIIIYPISGSVLFLLAAALLIGSIVFAIWYSIEQAKEESKNIAVKELTAGKRIAVLLNVIVVFASMAAVAYGFVHRDMIVGPVGILAWIVSSLIVAYTCSPLRLVHSSIDNAPRQGFAYLLFAPLLAIIAAVSMILIMLISWVFGLAAVMKGLTKKTFITIGLCIVLLIGAGFAVNYILAEKDAQDNAHLLELVESATEEAIQSIESGELKQVAISEEVSAVLQDQYNVFSVFSLNDVREACAEKLAQLYRDGDIDGLMKFFAFLDANEAGHMLAEDGVYDICFSKEYISSLIYYMEDHGTYLKTNGDNRIYSYEGHEVWLSSLFYVKLNYTVDGESRSGTILLGDPTYREAEHAKYSENSLGYFFVDETVEFVDSVLENNSSTTAYYPAGKCPECGTEFRANTSRAISYAKYGYCGLGLCGKD